MPHTERVNFTTRYLNNVAIPAKGRELAWDKTSRFPDQDLSGSLCGCCLTLLNRRRSFSDHI